MTLMTTRRRWLALGLLLLGVGMWSPSPVHAVCASCTSKCNNDFLACSTGCGSRYPGGGRLWERCVSRCEAAASECDLKCVDTTCTSGLTGTWQDVGQTCRGDRCRLDGTFEAFNPTNEATGNAVLRFYLSTDAVLDAGDTAVGDVALGVLQGHDRKTRQLHVLLDAGDSASGLFVIAHADADNDVPELNEDNNIVPFGPIP